MPTITSTPTSLLVLLLAACMPRPFPEDSLPKAEERPVYGEFQADFGTVWDATIQVVGDSAPIDEVDKDRGTLVTGWVTGASDYIFKTFGGTRIPEPIRYRLSVEVKNQGPRTTVKMVNSEQVEKDMISIDMEFTGAIYRFIDVPSSTAKERAMLEQILAIIEHRAGTDDYDYSY